MWFLINVSFIFTDLLFTLDWFIGSFLFILPLLIQASVAMSLFSCVQLCIELFIRSEVFPDIMMSIIKKRTVMIRVINTIIDIYIYIFPPLLFHSPTLFFLFLFVVHWFYINTKDVPFARCVFSKCILWKEIK